MEDNNLPKLALGTWLMGGTKNPDLNNDDQRDVRVIQTAIENGVTLIDTAQNYAAGKCEELVGKAVKNYDRSEFKILTKQQKENLSYDGVIDGCKSSLSRLGLEYLDYFVCHAPNQEFDMRDFFRASNQLYKDGLIKNVGVSNFGPRMLRLATKTSDIPIRLNQVSFSLTNFDIISTGTYDFCLSNNIPIQAYRSLVDLADNEELQTILSDISKALDISPHQLAIAYLNSYKNIYFTVRASSSEHWKQIKDALELTLPTKVIEKLRSYHESKTDVSRRHFLEI